MWYVVLALPVVAASVLAGFFAVLAARRREAPGAVPFAVLMAAVAWWTFTYGLELVVPTLGAKVQIAKIEYLGIVFVAPAWLAVALQYRSTKAAVSRRLAAVLAIEPLISLGFIWTNDWHQLYWIDNTLVMSGGFEFLKNDWGPAFWFQISASYMFLAAGMAVFVLAAWKRNGVYRRQALTLASGAAFPWIANLIVIAGFTPTYVDLTPFAFLLTGLAAYYSLFMFRLFDLVPVARETMFDEMDEGVLVVDSQGRVVDVNAAVVEMLGRPASELLGQRFPQLALPLSALDGASEDIRLAGIELHHAGMGQERVFDLSSVALASASEGYKGRLLVFLDVTERTLAERELQDYNRRLEDTVEERTKDLREANVQLATALNDLARTQHQIVQQERLSALGQMASGIAHEFNNSLSPIVGFSQVLLANTERFPEGSEERKSIDYILSAARDGAAIVANLREFYKPREQTKIEALDVSELIDFVSRMTRPRWREQPRSKGVEIEVVQRVDGHPSIMGDETSLRQVLTNLVFNAVDAMPEGGTLTIGAREEDSEVVVQVTDTGVGMSSDVVAHCMDPFFSTKGESGTGLGLALVQSIVNRHGGRVDVDSALGKGTTFTLTFPAAEAAASGDAAVRGKDMRPLRILSIDDDRAVLAVIDALVRSEGHSVDTFDDPIEALKQLHSSEYDVVISDLAMPSMSGDQIAEAVKRAYPHMPVILVTGFADALGVSGEEVQLAADLVLGKPVSAEKLHEALVKVTSRRPD